MVAAREELRRDLRRVLTRYARGDANKGGKGNTGEGGKSGERWITIGSTGNEDGTPVKIDGEGNIVAGPKGLADKGVDSLDDFGGDKKSSGDPKRGNPEKHREAIDGARVDRQANPAIARLDDDIQRLKSLLEEAKGALDSGEKPAGELHKTNRSTGPDSLGYPREKMPQIPGEHKEAFLKYLDAQNVDVRRRAVKVSSLFPVQAEVNGEKVDEMADRLLNTGTLGGTDPIVSSDGYVLDGHHRWAAHQAVSADERMIVHQADLPIGELLTVARSFPQSFKVGRDGKKSKYAAAPTGSGPGVKSPSLASQLRDALRSLTTDSRPSRYARWDESKHPRDVDGKFGHGGSDHPPGKAGGSEPSKNKPQVNHAGEAVELAKRMRGSTPKEVYAEIEKRHGLQNLDGHDTQTRYRRSDGSYSSERREVHGAIVSGAFQGVTPSENPVAVFMGGGPAAGKSSIVKSGQVSLPNNGKGVVDPDAIKSQLPEYAAGVEMGDQAAAAYNHEESSDVGSQSVAHALDGGLSYTLDGVGNSSYEKMASKVQKARDAGHRVEAHYVTCDTAEAERRATERAKRTGRMVPLERLRSSHKTVSEVVERAAGEGLFDELTLWDTNSQGEPVKVMESRGGQTQIHREDLWHRFLAKKSG